MACPPFFFYPHNKTRALHGKSEQDFQGGIDALTHLEINLIVIVALTQEMMVIT